MKARTLQRLRRLLIDWMPWGSEWVPAYWPPPGSRRVEARWVRRG